MGSCFTQLGLSHVPRVSHGLGRGFIPFALRGWPSPRSLDGASVREWFLHFSLSTLPGTSRAALPKVGCFFRFVNYSVKDDRRIWFGCGRRCVRIGTSGVSGGVHGGGQDQRGTGFEPAPGMAL